MIYEIVILAMIAAFLGMRLYSVLGRRAEHEEEPIPTRFDKGKQDAETATAPMRRQAMPVPRAAGVVPAVERGVQEIAAADRTFDLISFLEGAKGAYAMVLEAFWNGDRDTLKELCDDDVYAGFDAAITAREEAGETLDNRLIRIEDTTVHSADVEGRRARIAVRFVADIAAVTRDSDGNVVAGSLDDAIESRDVWTFSRNVDSPDPNWVLDETDEG
ncbi:Tim44/TimA family putative adaptor protein [Pelagerythrobacter marensis]|uniref:Preprotein translocase subunit Tim44 n=1 Tax=Pelagerythrobacter marensis TaxID=543877 RepID=A0A0G3XDR7_9SPHN|nr:Tim44/TimA family putative adaptor protein [Pelagerythrobacter marensis]AKM08744.1 Preprotein translocase subunit Tim44 [Pelagerythrobacter marensis]